MKRWLPLLIVLCLHTAAIACPMCKDSIPNSDSQSTTGVPTAFNTSVYLMLGAFLTVLALVGGGIFKAIRSADASKRPGFPLDK